MKKLLASLLLLLTVASASAQDVKQSSTVTPGHVPVWVSNGVIGDGGTAANGRITSLGVTNNNQLAICINSAATTAPYNRLCLSAGTTSSAVISLQNLGGATAQNLCFNVNGTSICLPSAPGSTFATISPPFTNGDIVCVNGSGGMYDCGVAPPPGTTTIVSGVATRAVTSADAGTLFLVETGGPPAQSSTVMTFDAAASFTTGTQIAFTKAVVSNHPGILQIKAHQYASTTATLVSGQDCTMSPFCTITVASATGIVAGQLVSGTGLPIPTYVDAAYVSGTTVRVTASPATSGSGIAVLFTDSIGGVPSISYDIPGDGITLTLNIAQKLWTPAGRLGDAMGSTIIGTHTVTSPTFNCTSGKYAVALATANKNLFQFDTTNGCVAATWGNPVSLTNTYNTGLSWNLQLVSTANPVRIYSPGYLLDGGNLFPYILYQAGDVCVQWTAGSDYRCLIRTDAHQSYIDNTQISGTTSIRTGNAVSAGTANIFLIAIPGAGDHIYVPIYGSAEHQWANRRIMGTVSRDVTDDSWGTAATTGTYNMFIVQDTNGTLNIALGPNALVAGLTLVDGVYTNTNAFACTAAICTATGWGNIPANTGRWKGIVTVVAGVVTNITDATGSFSPIYVNDVTGTGPVVQQTSPTLITPVLGNATGTSLQTSGKITAQSFGTPPGVSPCCVADFQGTDPAIRAISTNGGLVDVQFKSVGSSNLAFIGTITNHIFGLYSHAIPALWIATDQGLYTPNATGTTKGADTINSKGFYVDGTLLSAGSITGATLAANVLASSLTSVGTLTSLSVAGNVTHTTAASTMVLKQGANGSVGTFICTSGGTITINNSNIAITDAIIISLNAVGGTISTPPATKAITAATSFQVLCATNDTSTYNYAIIKNAAWLMPQDIPANDNIPMKAWRIAA